MKKSLKLIVILLHLMLFVSCTDTTEEVLEKETIEEKSATSGENEHDPDPDEDDDEESKG